MKNSYFYKKSIIYFSLIIFFLITSVLFFVNYKTDAVYNYIFEKSKDQIISGSKILQENIEKDILFFIEEIREKNSNDLDEILQNPTIVGLIADGRIEELKNLLNIDDGYYTTRDIKIFENNPKGKNLEAYENGLKISAAREITIKGKKYFVQLDDYLDKKFMKDIKKDFISYGDLIVFDSSKSSALKEKFEVQGLNKFVEEKKGLHNVYRIYIPYYDNEKKLIALIFYEIDMTFHTGLSEKMLEESNFLINNIKMYILIFSISFYLATILLINTLLKKIYDPLDEVFRIIDDLSRGKFGKKIFIENHDELKPLVKKINRLSGNLNFISRIKNEFLVKKSYEFKEVLDNLVGISEELIKNKDIDNNLRDDLRIIYENSNKLLTITRGLNDYYILEDDSIKLDESINLKKVIDEVTAILTNELKDKDLFVNNTISDRIYVRGDSLKLFILFTNIFDNSIKNSQNAEITIEATVLNSKLRVVISDKGRGINKNKLLNIREYLRGNEEIEDIGLGFILAKRILALHGGTIEISSEEGRGTKVEFSLQEAIIISDRNREKIEEIKRELELDSVDGGDKVLIYCNNYLNCQILVNFLKGNDYDLHIVETKEELLQYLKEKEISLLILDVLGDFVNDYKLVKEIRLQFSAKELPIVFINNRKKLDEDFNVFDMGVNDILEKPLSKDKLLIKIENQLALLNSQKVNKTLEQERVIVESVSSIQEGINSTLDTKKIFSILLKKVKELIYYDSAFILLKKESRYSIIFQEGYFDKEEKNDKLFKSIYLDPITNNGKIIRLNKYKCRDYFGEKIKAAVLIPFKYGDNNNCLIVLKSKEENFFRFFSKALIDKLSFNLSNSIKNAELYSELEEKNSHLNDLLHTLQSIDKLISVVYKEQDKNTAIYYILLILINKLKLGYREAYYFEYNKETNNLSCSNYFYSLKNYTEEKENKVSAKELWSKKVKLKLEKNNLLTRTFKEDSTCYLKELTTEDYELFGKMLKITILPVKYLDEKFGLIVLESDRKKKSVDEIEKEALRIISANLGIYLYNKRLEKESVKSGSSKTLNTFAKAIIHELRTPIVGVKGFANIVKEKYSYDKKLMEYMGNIIDDSERVLELSSQIVDYAEEKNLVYSYVEDNVRITLEEVLEEFGEEIKMEEIEVIYPKEDLFLVYDKSKIKRVFRHIIKNSLENMDYEKDKQMLRISFEKNEYGTNNLVFFDNGTGIEEENIRNIFEPLVSGKIQGTGLGLPISKNIIEKHNWDLTLESVKYNYTKVIIRTK